MMWQFLGAVWVLVAGGYVAWVAASIAAEWLRGMR